MNEPRGHAAMSGAILQPPTQRRLRLRRGLHRGVGLPADVRSRHHRRGHRAGRDRHGPGRRADHHGPARHAGRPGDRPGGRPRRARRVGDHRERAELRGARSTMSVSVPGFGDGAVQPGLRRQLLRDGRPRRCRACRSTAPGSTTSSPPGLAIMERINTTAPPLHPLIDGVDHCHHVEFIAPGSDARLSRHAMAIHPGWFDRSPCGTGTSARMAELWGRGELAPEHRLRQRVVHRRPVHRAADRRDRGRRHPGRGPDHHRPRLGDRASASTCSTPPTRSPPASRSSEGTPCA